MTRLIDLESSRLRRFAAGLLLTVLAVAHDVGFFGLPLLDALDRHFYDSRQRMHVARPDDRIVIVDVDEKSLAELGRWPWDRRLLAQLTQRLVDEANARVVAYDVVFAEPQPESDAALADAIAGRPVVLGYYFSGDLGASRVGALPPPSLPAEVLAAAGLRATSWDGHGANVERLQKASAAAGFFNPLIDPDGVVRALPLLAEFGGQLYESLAVATLRLHYGGAPLVLRGNSLSFGTGAEAPSVALSEGLTALVPYYGRGGPLANRFRYVSATDVLHGRVHPSTFAGRIVLVGTSAQGLSDRRATPVSQVYPGVEIHASMIAGVLDGRVRARPAEAPLLSAAATAIAGIGATALMLYLGVLGILGVATLAAVSLLTWNAVAYSNLGWVLPLSGGLALVLLLSALNLAVGYFIEGRSRRAVLGLFGQYIAPQLVERMAGDPGNHYGIDSQNKELTILFADIRGFTRIAESMEPQQLREYLNRFLTAMTEVIYAYNGTVDKYMGDAVMAFWGAPVEDNAHADHAVAAALAMQDEVARLNAEFELTGMPTLTVGIGINTGVVRVGDMGSRLRRAYTVIGDAVNLAARLEGISKRMNLPVAIGEATRLAVRTIALEYVAETEVQGRVERVKVFQPARGARAPAATRARDAARAAEQLA